MLTENILDSSCLESLGEWQQWARPQHQDFLSGGICATCAPVFSTSGHHFSKVSGSRSVDACSGGLQQASQGIPSTFAADTPQTPLSLVRCSKATGDAHSSLPGELIILMVCNFSTSTVFTGSSGRWLEKGESLFSNHSICGEL